MRRPCLRSILGVAGLETEERTCLKNHLITRSELRRRREEEEQAAAERNQQNRRKAKQEGMETKEKQIDNHYRKVRKKNKEITKTRAGENQKSRDLNRF